MFGFLLGCEPWCGSGKAGTPTGPRTSGDNGCACEVARRHRTEPHRGRVGMGYETVTAVPMYNGARNLMMLYAELGMNQRNAGVIIAFQCVKFPG